MLFILEKEGGKTAGKNEVLGKFFEFLKSDLNQTEVLKNDWIKDAQELAAHRNRASHAERYSHEEAIKVRDLTIELLKAF